jgi:hypothetical protein
MFHQSELAVSVAADAVLRLLDAGGTLKVYAGPRPARVEDSVPYEQLLSEHRFSTEAFHPARGGRAEAKAITDAFARRSGTPTFFQACSPDGVAVFEGTVGARDEGANLVVSPPALRKDFSVSITRLTFGIPASAEAAEQGAAASEG